MQLQFAPYQLVTKKMRQSVYVLDVVRKKYVNLSAEEFVRQQVLHFILDKCKYPIQAIAVEKQFNLGELKKRFDIVVFKHNKPWLIIECKRNSVPLSSQTLQQIVEYNMKLNANYLVITNGSNFFGYNVSDGNLQVLQTLPNW